MEHKMLILCDREKDYALQMAAYLEKDKDFPWQVVVYTGKEDLEDFLKEHPPQILLLAESMVEKGISGYPAQQIVLLNESGKLRFPEFININKYQEAENVRRELIQILTQHKETVYPILGTPKTAKIIGFYTPVKRCLQTTCAISCGQLLAQKGNVLYFNFEHYCGNAELESEEIGQDLGALLYRLDSEQDRFGLFLKTIRRSLGNWDYVPAMRNGENFPEIPLEEWLRLLKNCISLNLYDYIVLDLSEAMQGLFEILRKCSHVVTIEKEDPISQCKLQQYERLLEQKGYKEVKENTIKCVLPKIGKLPEGLENYTRGELADYLRRKLCIQQDPSVSEGGMETYGI